MAFNRRVPLKAHSQGSRAMVTMNDADPTRFEFPLTEKANRAGQHLLLTKADVKELPIVARQVLALLEFLPSVLEPTTSLEGTFIVVHVLPSSSAPANMTISDVHDICIDALSSLGIAANDIKSNAGRTNPLPLNAVVAHKGAYNLLRALANGNDELQHGITLKSRGLAQQLPVLTPADFTSADSETNQRKTGTFRIVGLIRGDNEGTHQLVLAGGLRVALPRTKRWTWVQIHDVLDYEASVAGTLIRESIGDPWSLSDETHIERQPPLF
jgi:hypothetical protein